ncbi:MAG: SulP family inorganic anion transporter [Caldilineaceae bacterium]
MMLVLGLLRLGSMVNHVSNGVMTGFVAAASLLIVIGEMGDFSGYSPSGSNKLMEVVNWLANIPQWNMTVTAVSSSTVALMLVFKWFPRTEKMAAIFTLFIMTIAVYLLKLDVPLVSSIATIPRGLPTPALPAFALIPKLALGSLSVALVALVQGAGISTAYPNPDGTRAGASRDFVGQGIGNLLGSFFQSMGTGGSLSRTGISVEAGAKSLGRQNPRRSVAGADSHALRQPGRVGAAIGHRRHALRHRRRADCGAHPQRQTGLSHVVGLRRRGAADLRVGALHPPAIHDLPGGIALAPALHRHVGVQRPRLPVRARRGRPLAGSRSARRLPVQPQATVVAYRGANFFAEVPAIMAQMPSQTGVTNAVIIWRLRSVEEVHSTFLKQLLLFAQEAHASGNRFDAGRRAA